MGPESKGESPLAAFINTFLGIILAITIEPFETIFKPIAKKGKRALKGAIQEIEK